MKRLWGPTGPVRVRRGYLLVEALVAGAVASILLATAMNVLAGARQSTNQRAKRSSARTLLNSMQERIRDSNYHATNTSICDGLPSGLASDCTTGGLAVSGCTWRPARLLDDSGITDGYRTQIEVCVRTSTQGSLASSAYTVATTPSTVTANYLLRFRDVGLYVRYKEGNIFRLLSTTVRKYSPNCSGDTKICEN